MVILLRAEEVFWGWAAYAKPGVELRKAQLEKMITTRERRGQKGACLFTPQLSNNVRANPNKFVVLQQIKFSLDPGRFEELQMLPSAFARTDLSLGPLHQ